MSQPSPQEIEELKAKVAPRDLHSIEVGDGDDAFVMLVTPPTRPEWMKYLSDLSSTEDITKKVGAHEALLMAVTHWPDRETVRKFINTRFAAVPDVMDEISKLVGAGDAVRAKKL